MAFKVVDHGEYIGKSFSRASFITDYDISASHDNGNNFTLDWSGHFEATNKDSLIELINEGILSKASRLFFVSMRNLMILLVHC